MLQLHNIRKSYTTGDFTQVALNDVSISFRDNEFVAILGPSGSGKTTLLNIIGGLDHYDEGNLVIDGISTEQYKDRDWDAYRNNRIGFVFQSYNLIPHQTILANVELALTLSGVSRAERRERAVAALERVGLGDHVNKKPSQLSGGQMQRVAIARALINDPEILLADEPTGALDSKTSVQVMDLLTEIAHDRLVIMVTHNPELAEQYATRIVTLADGEIRNDSDPVDPETETMRQSEKPVRKTSMSFLTALTLSFTNLMTKKGRTIMTAFAGSIGIIGIAAILALANGVNNYIKSVEEDTLSEYPLTLQDQGFDITSMMTGGVSSSTDDGEAAGESDDATAEAADGNAAADAEEAAPKPVQESKMLTGMFGSIGSNDLGALKEYLDADGGGIGQYVNSIEYSYNIMPQIYNADTENGVRQVNPDQSFSALGLGAGGTSNSMMSSMMNTNMFYEMPSDTTLVEGQYDVMAGHWPEAYNECIVVLTPNGRIPDMMLYTMGLRDADELDDMVRQFANEEEVSVPADKMELDYEDLLNVQFKLVNAADCYAYDAEYDVWKDKHDDATYMTELINEGETLNIVGVLKPKPEATITSLATAIYYTPELVTHVIEQAAESDIVQSQLESPDINVFSGKSFVEEEEDAGNELNMESLFTVDGQALNAAFRIDESKLAVDMSDALNLQGSLQNMPDVPEPDMQAMAGQMDLSVTPEQTNALVKSVMGGFEKWYQAYLKEHPPVVDPDDPTKPPATPDFSELFSQYLNTPEAQALLAAGAAQIAQENNWETQVATALQGYMQTTMTTYMGAMATELQTQVTAALQQSMDRLAGNMASAMSIDAEAFQDAFQMTMSEEELSELIMSLMVVEETSYDNNLRKLGYADFARPASIDIYPKDFESKGEVLNILDSYNDRMEAEGQKEKVVSYTDVVGALMSSVTDIVNMISYVLVAFVAISLVVSSIMIGIITYISVLERKKEIGILRSIGASKRDISRVFNAETLIVGLTAGLIGIGVTAAVCVPVNMFALAVFDVRDVAILPWTAALVLVGISMLLTFVAGLIPSRAASRKDPVEALRSE